MKILVVYKESTYSKCLCSRNLMRGLKRVGSYWNIVLGSHRRHQLTLRTVVAALKSKGFTPMVVMRKKIHLLKKVDERFCLAVTIGGDGTLLDTSHYVGKIPILGVNSDPYRSVAHFSGCQAENFGKVFQAFWEGRLKPVVVSRLEFSINGVKAKWPVLNDLLVCTSSPAGTSRYNLKVGNRKEEQMSSGIWISSAVGSTAALCSAGGKALPAGSRKFQFIVREPYHEKFGTRRLLKGILAPGRTLQVISRMKDGKIFVDGSSLSVCFCLGDRLSVKVSDQPLRIVGFK